MSVKIPTGAQDAVFSPCRTWRYLLVRRWSRLDGGKDMLAVIGLNPSTADESADDPTVTRCIRRAFRMGFGGLFMLNLFAFRSTDPAGLKTAADPIGPENDAYLRSVTRDSAALVIAAWGVHGSLHARAETVLREVLDGPVFCLGVTKENQPRHPLYLPNDQPLALYRPSRDGLPSDVPSYEPLPGQKEMFAT